MLNYDEKQKVKEMLQEVLQDLNVNPMINMAYFLNSIDETNKKIKSLESKMQIIIQNQALIDQKLDIIMRKIMMI